MLERDTPFERLRHRAPAFKHQQGAIRLGPLPRRDLQVVRHSLGVIAVSWSPLVCSPSLGEFATPFTTPARRSGSVGRADEGSFPSLPNIEPDSSGTFAFQLPRIALAIARAFGL